MYFYSSAFPPFLCRSSVSLNLLPLSLTIANSSQVNLVMIASRSWWRHHRIRSRTPEMSLSWRPGPHPILPQPVRDEHRMFCLSPRICVDHPLARESVSDGETDFRYRLLPVLSANDARTPSYLRALWQHTNRRGDAALRSCPSLLETTLFSSHLPPTASVPPPALSICCHSCLQSPAYHTFSLHLSLQHVFPYRLFYLLSHGLRRGHPQNKSGGSHRVDALPVHATDEERG